MPTHCQCRIGVHNNATKALMKNKIKTRLFILLAAILVIGLLTLGGLYFFRSFFSAFAPADITVTKSEIRSSRSLINPITIEKLKVDSFGNEQRPIKYTIVYLTTCSIKQIDGKPPVGLKIIKLNETGHYGWSEENVNIPIAHYDGFSSRNRLDSIQDIIWSTGHKKMEVCPINFEKENWYFINFLEPGIVGIYIYVDKNGDLNQYTTYSGVSPI
jgi:hypothetical protein